MLKPLHSVWGLVSIRTFRTKCILSLRISNETSWILKRIWGKIVKKISSCKKKKERCFSYIMFCWELLITMKGQQSEGRSGFSIILVQKSEVVAMSQLFRCWKIKYNKTQKENFLLFRFVISNLVWSTQCYSLTIDVRTFLKEELGCPQGSNPKEKKEEILYIKV